MASNYTQISTIKAAYSSGYAASQGSYNATTGSPTFTVIQVVYYGTGTLSSPSVTDNQGNTWTLVYNAGWTPSGSGDANCLIFACANPTLSTTYSWTVTLASSGTFHLMAVWTGYSGGVPSSLTPLATTWGTLTSSANYINVASNYTLTSGNKGALIIMMGGGPNSDGSGVGTGTAPPYGGTAGNGSFNSFNNGSQYGHVGGSAAGGFYGMWHSDSSTTYNNSCYAYMGSDHCFAGTIMFGPPSTTPNSYTQNLTETALSFTETFVAGNNLNKSYSETAFPLTETFSAAHTYGLSLAETDLSFVETFVTLHRETVGTKYYFLVMSPESVALSENVAEHHTYSKLITDALGILSEPFIIGKSFLRTYTEAIFPLTETFRKAIVPNPLPTDSITLNDLTVNTKHGFNPSLGLDQFTISDLTLTAQHYVSESLSDYAGFGETSFTTYHNRAVSISETAFPLTETFSIATHIHYTQTFAETSFGISDALAPNSLSYPFTEVGTVTPNEVGFTYVFNHHKTFSNDVFTMVSNGIAYNVAHVQSFAETAFPLTETFLTAHAQSKTLLLETISIYPNVINFATGKALLDTQLPTDITVSIQKTLHISFSETDIVLNETFHPVHGITFTEAQINLSDNVYRGKLLLLFDNIDLSFSDGDTWSWHHTELDSIAITEPSFVTRVVRDYQYSETFAINDETLTKAVSQHALTDTTGISEILYNGFITIFKTFAEADLVINEFLTKQDTKKSFAETDIVLNETYTKAKARFISDTLTNNDYSINFATNYTIHDADPNNPMVMHPYSIISITEPYFNKGFVHFVTETEPDLTFTETFSANATHVLTFFEVTDPTDLGIVKATNFPLPNLELIALNESVSFHSLDLHVTFFDEYRNYMFDLGASKATSHSEFESYSLTDFPDNITHGKWWLESDVLSDFPLVATRGKVFAETDVALVETFVTQYYTLGPSAAHVIYAERPKRLFQTECNGGILIMRYGNKVADSCMDFDVDFSGALANLIGTSDPIISTTWTAPGGTVSNTSGPLPSSITLVGTATFAGTISRGRLWGGTLGVAEIVEVEVTTLSGQQFVQNINIQVSQ